MLRILFWIVVTVMTLGTISYEVTYTDGLHIKSVGWPERLTNWWKNIKW